MATLSKNWSNGGTVDVTYTGDGNGSAIFSSTPNTGGERTMTVRFVDGGRSIVVERLIKQAGQAVSQDTYTRVTYIECNGQQYINTGYVVQEDDIIEMMYISTSTTSADKALYGCYDDNGNIWFSIYSNTGYVRFGSSASASITNARMTYKLTMQKSSVVMDSGNKATPDFVGLPQVPLYLFARNNKNTGVGMYGYCQCMSFSIKNGSGELVMDLKP